MSSDINNSLNNNHNSVITIIKEVLGEEAQSHIVKRLSYEILEHFSRSEVKLDKSLENDKFMIDLSKQIFESVKSNTSLTELLLKSEKERELLLEELEKIKKEHINSSTDVDFSHMIEEAEEALKRYDSKKYRDILESYRENKKNQEFRKNLAITHYLSAKSFASDFMFQKAEEEINIAVALDRKNGDYAGWYGFILLNLSQYTKALEYLEKSLDIRVEIGDKLEEGTTLNNISKIYHVRGDLTKALEYLEKSLNIRVEIGDKPGEGITLNNISQIYQARGDLTKALEYLEKSLDIVVEIGDKSGEGATLNNISQIYQAQGNLTKALEYLEKSLDIRVEIGDKSGECVSLFNIGHIHLAKDEREEALGAWLRVYAIAKEIEYAEVLEALDGLAQNNGFENFEALKEEML